MIIAKQTGKRRSAHKLYNFTLDLELKAAMAFCSEARNQWRAGVGVEITKQNFIRVTHFFLHHLGESTLKLFTYCMLKMFIENINTILENKFGSCIYLKLLFHPNPSRWVKLHQIERRRGEQWGEKRQDRDREYEIDG